MFIFEVDQLLIQRSPSSCRSIARSEGAGEQSNEDPTSHERGAMIVLAS